ncbi:uncharacterized protein [Diadema antillarum]|uniref:uncharacterized protein n=1 Tax=Diadema antillarum TaxID=105358 RepID=UPI003A89C747
MAACQFSVNLEPTSDCAHERDTGRPNNDLFLLPTVTVRDTRNLSISSDSAVGSSSSSQSSSASSSAASSPGASPTSSGGVMEVLSSKSQTDNAVNMQLDLSSMEPNANALREKLEDLSSNNNNLNFNSPTKDKLLAGRRSLIRSNSSACSSISEEGVSDESESENSSSSSPRNRPPLQRTAAIREDVDIFHDLSPRSSSPISTVEELETYSGIKTVVRRQRKSQGGRTSPSWRWSVMGVATGDFDAVTRATHKSKHHNHHHSSNASASTPSPSAGGNGHAPVGRRSSLVGPSALVSPRTRRLSTEFRRLSLQMDMPWRDPNERLVKFADWLNKRTEELMERSARARQKTYELLRLAKRRQKDTIEF